MNAHDPEKAIELLQANVPYELGTPQSSFDGFYGALYPIYVRGLANLQLGRAYLQSGDMTGARVAYKDIQTLWKGADPELPIWKQSQLEFGRIQGPDDKMSCVWEHEQCSQ